MNDVGYQFSCGFYGKIPSVGDFVSRDIPRHYLQHIDDWFSEGMAALSAESQNWLGSYLTAPVWSFVVCPGVWGEEYLYGAVMPSVDSVGRYFPFISLTRNASFSSIDHELINYLPSLADELPAVLQGDLLPEEVCDFLAQHVRPDVSNTALSNLNELTEAGKSYWWCAIQYSAPYQPVVHDGQLNYPLFKQLFFRYPPLLP